MIRIALVSTLALTAARAELTATFKSGDSQDARTDDLPALLVKAGEPVTPFLAAGPFEATWSGKLVIPERQRLVFSFEGTGTASLTIDGKAVLEESGTLGAKPSERTRLNPGEHDVTITFKSQPDGSGRFRLFWEEASFYRHAIPSSAFKGQANEEVSLGNQLRKGRMLFAENHCAKCHTAASGFGAMPMPEMMEMGPLLAGSGDRVNEEWLRRWIADPHALRPGTHMPALVDGKTEEGRQKAADIAAYVSAQKLNTPESKAADASLASKGGEHFHTLGCVACHTRPDQAEPDRDHKRLPLNNVASKFKPGALTAFLKKPDAFHPFSSMPNFRLSDEEANALSAFLTTSSTGKETKLEGTFPAGDVTRGEAAVKALNCGSCHPGLPMADKPMSSSGMDAIFAKDWSAGGCVAAPDKRGKAPVLNLSDDDRAALVVFSKMGSAPLTRDTQAEFAHRQIGALRCIACHANNGQPALMDSVHTESRSLYQDTKKLDERVDQSRPQLTYMGEMLHAPYIESMIDGSVKQRPRPWLLMRMPSFTLKAKSLSEGMARMHGILPEAAPAVVTDPANVEIGKQLTGAQGFGCTTCHGIGDAKPTAAFEVEGVNLKLTPERLRAEYFYHWMDNPRAVTPSTKMPRYSEENKSQRSDVLEGDAHKQFEAIWQYLHAK